MAQLSQPSETLCRKIIRTVPFNERFPAGRLKPHMGIVPGNVRSLQELHQFLTPDIASLPGLNLKRLPEWIESRIGDRELAAEVRRIVSNSVSYVDECKQIYEVLCYRLNQVRQVIKEVR